MVNLGLLARFDFKDHVRGQKDAAPRNTCGRAQSATLDIVEVLCFQQSKPSENFWSQTFGAAKANRKATAQAWHCLQFCTVYIYIYTSCFLRAWIQDFLDSHNKIDAFLVLRFFTRQPLPKTPSKTTSSIWAVSSTSLLLRDYPQKLVKKMVRQKLAPKLLRRVKIDRPPKSSIALAWCRLSLWQE